MAKNYVSLSEEEIARRMAKLSGWQREGGEIKKTFDVESYIAGHAFTSAIGTICEGLDHHPERLCIGWKKVEVSFTTHAANNSLTVYDFDCADAIEALPLKATT